MEVLTSFFATTTWMPLISLRTPEVSRKLLSDKISSGFPQAVLSGRTNCLSSAITKEFAIRRVSPFRSMYHPITRVREFWLEEELHRARARRTRRCWIPMLLFAWTNRPRRICLSGPEPQLLQPGRTPEHLG